MNLEETNAARLRRGRDAAAQMFAAGALRLEAPAEIDQEWRRFLAASVLGDVWARDGLSLRDRSLVTNAVLIALARTEDLKIHLASALHLGISREELCEAIWQVGVYAGFPVANAAFNVANGVFENAGDASADESRKETT
jgi:alkylhydroperoxidase/carboxymuconolactone decarboxylase family protein YurZ